MSLAFRGASIAGTHEALALGPWDHDRFRTKFPGVVGESEIVGTRGGRDITIPVWIHGNYSTSSALTAALETLNSWIGLNGTLAETGTVARTLKHCTFDGFEPVGEGPTYDPVLKWLQPGTLRFRQLSPQP